MEKDFQILRKSFITEDFRINIEQGNFLSHLRTWDNRIFVLLLFKTLTSYTKFRKHLSIHSYYVYKHTYLTIHYCKHLFSELRIVDKCEQYKHIT